MAFLHLLYVTSIPYIRAFNVDFLNPAPASFLLPSFLGILTLPHRNMNSINPTGPVQSQSFSATKNRKRVQWASDLTHTRIIPAHASSSSRCSSPQLSIITEFQSLSYMDSHPTFDPYQDTYSPEAASTAHLDSLLIPSSSAYSSTSVYDDPLLNDISIDDNDFSVNETPEEHFVPSNHLTPSFPSTVTSDIDYVDFRLAAAQHEATTRFSTPISDTDGDDILLLLLTQINSVFNAVTFLPTSLDEDPSSFLTSHPLLTTELDLERCRVYDYAIKVLSEAVSTRFCTGQRYVDNLALRKDLEEFYTL